MLKRCYWFFPPICGHYKQKRSSHFYFLIGHLAAQCLKAINGKNIFVLFYQLVSKKNAVQSNYYVQARKLLSFSVFPMSQFIHLIQFLKITAVPIISLCVENEVGLLQLPSFYACFRLFFNEWVMWKKGRSSKICEVSRVAFWYLWRGPLKKLKGQWNIAASSGLFCPHDSFHTHPGNWWMED